MTMKSIATQNITMSNIKEAFDTLKINFTTDAEIIKKAYDNIIEEKIEKNERDLNNINQAYYTIKEWLKIRQNNDNYNHCLSILNYLSKQCQIVDLSENIPEIFQRDYQRAYNEVKYLNTKITNMNKPTPSEVNNIKDKLKQIIDNFKDNILNTYKHHFPHIIIEKIKEKLKESEYNYNLNHVYTTIFNELNQLENIRLNNILINKNDEIDAFYAQFKSHNNYLLIKNIIEQRKLAFKDNLIKNRFQKIDLLELFIKEKIIINRLFDEYTPNHRSNQNILQDTQTLITYQLMKASNDINYKNYLPTLTSIKNKIAYLSNNTQNIDQDTFNWIINTSLQMSLSNKQIIKNLNTSLHIICYTIKEKTEPMKKTFHYTKKRKRK